MHDIRVEEGVEQNSPLWPRVRMGWARGQRGLVFVEKRLWYTAKAVVYFSFLRSL